jgi:hypothetical protein
MEALEAYFLTLEVDFLALFLVAVENLLADFLGVLGVLLAFVFNPGIEPS